MVEQTIPILRSKNQDLFFCMFTCPLCSMCFSAYWARRDIEERKVNGIKYEQDIVIYDKTQ